MEYSLLAIAFVGGFAAGCINLLAGNGSAITLTILTEIVGLPPNVANGTNRIGVWTNSLSGMAAFAKQGKRDLSGTWGFIISTFVGGVIGVYLATLVTNDQFKEVFKFMMVLMLFVVLFKPDRWIKQAQVTRDIPIWVAYPIYFIIGIYGGFIQMGMGIFFLIVMVFIARYHVIKANFAKMLIVLGFTSVSLVVFAWKGYMAWEYGLVLALGQGLGAWIFGNYAARSPRAGLLAYWMLVIGVILAVIKLFELHTYILG
jgi:uncharacterized membrane protein YfcA